MLNVQDYLFLIKEKIFSDEEFTYIRDFGSRYENYENTGGFNWMSNAKKYEILELVQSKFNTEIDVCFFRLLKNGFIPLHRDNCIPLPYTRESILVMPLNPEVDYKPTYFVDLNPMYRHQKDLEATPIVTCPTEIGSAYVLNGFKWHAIVETPVDRYSFQITFLNQSYRNVLKMYQQNKLLNTDNLDKSLLCNLYYNEELQ